VQSILEPRRFRLELQLMGIISNHPDIAIREAVGRFGLDFERELNLRSLGFLQFHDHRTQDGVERLHRRTMSISTEP
jgi:hypothetical protein